MFTLRYTLGWISFFLHGRSICISFSVNSISLASFSLELLVFSILWALYILGLSTFCLFVFFSCKLNRSVLESALTLFCFSSSSNNVTFTLLAQWSLNIWWLRIYISDLCHYFFKLSLPQIQFDFIRKPDVPMFPLSFSQLGTWSDLLWLIYD